MPVTFKKYNEVWCLRSDDALRIGDVVTVTKRDGSTSRETVGPLLTFGPDFWIYNIARQAAAAPHGATAARDPDDLQVVQLSDTARLFQLFDRAAQHLQRVAVRLTTPS